MLEPGEKIGPQTYPTLSSTVSPGQHPYSSRAARVNFLLYLPYEYGKDPQREWPLILYLHGASAIGYDLEALKKKGLPEMLEDQADFPFIVASPQMHPEVISPQMLSELYNWSDMIDSLNILLNEIQTAVSTDSRRVYLTGFSMGGAGTWQFALHYPQRFAALVPVAGYYLDEGYNIPDNLCDLRDIPVWAFHGGHDVDLPPYGAEVFVEAFKACGGNIQFTLYPTADHEETWRQAYADPELTTWLLSQVLR
jgi:predicted peptidase